MPIPSGLDDDELDPDDRPIGFPGLVGEFAEEPRRPRVSGRTGRGGRLGGVRNALGRLFRR